MIWLLIIMNILIIIIEVPGLLRKQLYRDLTVFMVLFIIGLYMGLAFMFQWPLVAPFQAFTTYAGERY